MRAQGGGLDYKSNNYLQPPPIPQSHTSELEKALMQLTKTTTDYMQGTDAFRSDTSAFIHEARTSFKNQDSFQLKQQAQKRQYARKHKLQDCETVALTEECSAIIQKKFPPKLRDPGSFNIPIAIGNTHVGRALCDLGAIINLISLSICKPLGISELKPTMISLQIADRSLRRPNGVIEDVLIKVDKFISPADFIVLDMEEESEIPLLLGRPFLATARSMIVVEQGKLEQRMNDETITINVFDAMKNSSDQSDCFRLDVFEEVVKEGKVDDQELEEELKTQEEATPQEEKEFVFEVLKKKENDLVTVVPKTELKELPKTLKYSFLGDEKQYLVIINKELSTDEEKKLLEVLKEHKTAIV
ncbi:uncharacterized protein LOC133286136 [Gastrolobium bilobum]|uniref:uncharacterized protein LOC133286136 n=1 Tax=Gastrolobium bilobum TaxID=150636 RepID=UPI002AB009F7|nr:uncharacterized protein LOC133286136 [Gastrolobium bilobum]